jgi:hypothetical protein
VLEPPAAPFPESLFAEASASFTAEYLDHHVEMFGKPLGDQLEAQPNLERAMVTDVPAAVAIAVGAHRSCAITSSGEVQCWGLGRGNGVHADQLVTHDRTRRYRFGPEASVVQTLPLHCDAASFMDPIEFMHGRDNDTRASAVQLATGYDTGTWENLHAAFSYELQGSIQLPGVPSTYRPKELEGIRVDGYAVRLDGNLYPSGDRDWFVVDAIDYSSFSDLDPVLRVQGGPTQVCAYYEAAATWTTEVTCRTGTPSSIPAYDTGSQPALNGCCLAGEQYDLSMVLNASGVTDETGKLYVLVEADPAAAGACSSFSIGLEL